MKKKTRILPTPSLKPPCPPSLPVHGIAKLPVQQSDISRGASCNFLNEDFKSTDNTY